VTTVADRPVAAPAAGAPSSPRRRGSTAGRLGRAVQQRGIVAFSVLVLGYLFLPVVVVVVFSFNDPAGRFNFAWQGFTTDAWRHPCAPAGMCAAVGRSLQIGVLATVVATVLGTLLAFGLVRHRFRGRATTSLLVFLPMATPEVVMGASLLTLFVNLGVQTGFATIVIAHILFNVSYVVVTVKARLAGMDSRLEEAAMDLYANEWQTFRRITLPLAAPGIFAGALLAFTLSFDDFIITNFNSGNTITFPMFVWGAAQRGVPPQVNVIGTAMFVLALLAVAAGELVSRARRA
jgi:spermidine/putrescine transport system permease protein